MYRDFFKTAVRNLLQSKGYSLINITGLSVGMAVAMLVGLWIFVAAGGGAMVITMAVVSFQAIRPR